MDTTKKIKTALTYAGVTQAELAKRMDTTAPNIAQRISRGTFPMSDLETIAELIGCKFVAYFEFPDGTKI